MDREKILADYVARRKLWPVESGQFVCEMGHDGKDVVATVVRADGQLACAAHEHTPCEITDEMLHDFDMTNQFQQLVEEALSAQRL